MIWRKNGGILSLVVLAVLCLGVGFLCERVNADEWASGSVDADSGGGQGMNANDYYDCYSIRYCPRWIKVSKSTYDQIRSQGRIIGNYTALPACGNDSWIIIAGNVRANDNKVQLYNLVGLIPSKSEKRYQSVAYSLSDVRDGVGFLWQQNDDGVTDESGKILTYNEILSRVVRMSGVSEENLAVFCPSMIAPSVFASSKLTINPDSIVTDTGIKNGQIIANTGDLFFVAGEEKTLEFEHNIYAGSKMNNVKWEVSKEFKKDGQSFDLGGGTGGNVDGTANIETTFSGQDGANFISNTSPQYQDKYEKVRFSLAATYQFCESISVNNKKMTGVCANVLVPYNYSNTAEAKLEKNTVFAGETASMRLKVDVRTKYNNKTDATYATQVENARIKAVSYVSNNDGGEEKNSVGYGEDYNICNEVSVTGRCDEILNEGNKALNVGGKNGLGESTGFVVDSFEKTTTKNVYDEVAGRYYCVVMAVYPANSGGDDNLDAKGSNSWFVSKPSCAKIAKKPSLQVFGAGLFSNGSIALPNATKHVVAGRLNDYSANTADNVVFGSYVEQNLVANGLVRMASGAADGMAGSTVRTKNGLSGSYNGSADSNYICILSPLTMPNSKCSGVMSPGGSIGMMQVPKDREIMTSKIDSGVSEKYELHDGVCEIAVLPSFEIRRTHIYNCGGDLNVVGDLSYFVSGATYNLSEDIPKIIIKARNINIGCGVTRVDAILVADGIVSTCPDVKIDDKETYNKSVASSQLKINGAIVADRIVAGRTYGAATGVNSGEPAEIINYDTSLYLWGSSDNKIVDSGKIVTTYLSELPPRY